MPRFLISSAISRPVQWLIGLPESSGSSHAIPMIWHTWSAVIRAGAPGRGRSSSRSSTLSSLNGMGCNVNHLSRQRRAVCTSIPSSRAIVALFFPSAAANTIRARSAICWRVLCRRTKVSKSWLASSVSSTIGGLGPGNSFTSATELRQSNRFFQFVKPRRDLRRQALGIHSGIALVSILGAKDTPETGV
jgi:hypothetical protein